MYNNAFCKITNNCQVNEHLTVCKKWFAGFLSPVGVSELVVTEIKD